MTVRRPQESAVDPLSDEFIRYRRQKGWAAEHTLLDEIDRQRATIRGLEAENARLREALERILAATPEGREEHRIARKSLEASR